MMQYVFTVFKFYSSMSQTAGILIWNDFHVFCSTQIKLLSVSPLQTLDNKTCILHNLSNNSLYGRPLNIQPHLTSQVLP